ncbi:MAG: thioesterase family protein [Proteobacteria bacterium]|nr:thioesterase family protein [Pseudomonadota bacterium]
MNLYLRLIWLLLRLPWMKKQTNPLQPTTLTMRVCLNDLDLNLHVNNGRILTLMDLGRIHLMAKTGLLKPIFKYRWMPVLGSAKVHFIRPLGPFKKFTMLTQVIFWDEKWIYMEQKIIVNDELCVVALFKTLFIHKQGKLPPDELIRHLPSTINKPPMPHHLKNWLDAERKPSD